MPRAWHVAWRHRRMEIAIVVHASGNFWPAQNLGVRTKRRGREDAQLCRELLTRLSESRNGPWSTTDGIAIPLRRGGADLNGRTDSNGRINRQEGAFDYFIERSNRSMDTVLSQFPHRFVRGHSMRGQEMMWNLDRLRRKSAIGRTQQRRSSSPISSNAVSRCRLGARNVQ